MDPLRLPHLDELPRRPGGMSVRAAQRRVLHGQAAAALLNVDVSTVSTWCEAGILDAVRGMPHHGPRWIAPPWSRSRRCASRSSDAGHVTRPWRSAWTGRPDEMRTAQRLGTLRPWHSARTTTAVLGEVVFVDPRLGGDDSARTQALGVQLVLAHGGAQGAVAAIAVEFRGGGRRPSG